MIEINGVSLDVRANDADFLDVYAKAARRMQDDATAIPEDDLAASVRYQVKCIRDFFDAVFGKDTGKKVIPKDDMIAAFGATEAVAIEVMRQRDELQERLQRYMPRRLTVVQ